MAKNNKENHASAHFLVPFSVTQKNFLTLIFQAVVVCTYAFIQVDPVVQFDSKSPFINVISGEHASCGPSLHESGFTYDPADFMKANIFFYNFAWKDFGEASMVGLLDMVKVLSFALSEGKVAVHCHAGLGRTGKLNISIQYTTQIFFFQNSPREYTLPVNMKCKK